MKYNFVGLPLSELGRKLPEKSNRQQAKPKQETGPKHYPSQQNSTSRIVCLCGIELKKHPICDACHIYLVSDKPKCDFTSITVKTDVDKNGKKLGTYRGHKLCPGCVRRWQINERAAGRELTFEEMTMFSPNT